VWPLKSSQKDIICVYRLLAPERGLDCLFLRVWPLKSYVTTKHTTLPQAASTVSFYHHAIASRRRKRSSRGTANMCQHMTPDLNPRRCGQERAAGKRRVDDDGQAGAFPVSNLISALCRETIPTRRCDTTWGPPAHLYNDSRLCFYRRPGSDPGRAAAGRPAGLARTGRTCSTSVWLLQMVSDCMAS
jgi:hypothetical protein